MEDNITKIEAVDLDTERRLTVLSRPLGIAEWSARQMSDGRVSVSAQMGFSRESVDDVAQLFQAAPSTTSAASGPAPVQ
ncbi:MAG: hypothetical protein MZW92_57300 [Comamonadaceae bacterium]|nr:hypothetical protein [Comamonadaceae bacterium]